MRAEIKTAGGARRRPREVTGRTVLFYVVAFFGVVALVNAVMVRAAISTFGGLETESSYKAGLTFAREIASAEEQNKRQWNVTAKLSPMVDGHWSMQVTALDAAGRPLIGYDAVARLSHPTDRRLDHVIDMAQSGPGRFKGETAAATPGQWDLVIDLVRGDERLFRSRERVVLKDAGPQ